MYILYICIFVYLYIFYIFCIFCKLRLYINRFSCQLRIAVASVRAGDSPSVSDVRGPFRTKIPKHVKTNNWYENCSHFWDILGFSEQFSKSIFEPCSYIELNTQNLNTIFRITIYCTKYTPNPKHFSFLLDFFENNQINTFVILYFVFCINTTIHTLFFLYFL